MTASRVGLAGIARREGLVETIGAVAKAALVAKDVRIGDPAAAVRVDLDTKVDTKAGQAVAVVDDRSNDSRKLN